MPAVAVVYYSAQGHTHALAQSVGEGAGGVPGTTVELVRLQDADIQADGGVTGAAYNHPHITCSPSSVRPAGEFCPLWGMSMTPTLNQLRQFLLGTLPTDGTGEIADWLERDPQAAGILTRSQVPDPLAGALAQPALTGPRSPGSSTPIFLLSFAFSNANAKSTSSA